MKLPGILLLLCAAFISFCSSAPKRKLSEPSTAARNMVAGAIFRGLTRSVFSDVLKQVTTKVLRSLCLVAKFVDTAVGGYKDIIELPPLLSLLGYQSGQNDCENVVYPGLLRKIFDVLQAS